jgi:hypothetical protein
MPDTVEQWPALIGKAGEALVGAELMRRGVHVAYPAYDGGVDLVAYHEDDHNRFVPVQVKARSGTLYNFQKLWFKIKGIVLVQVWFVRTEPKFYIFSELSQVEAALGPIHSASLSWKEKGGYNVTNPGPDIFERMEPHLDQWQRITSQLGTGEGLDG